ncbi:MAG: hypothetical protein ABI193_26850, partial [Minicystis sp.]
ALLLPLSSLACKREPVSYTVTIRPALLPRSAPFRLLNEGAALPVTRAEDGTVTVSFTTPGNHPFSEHTSLALELTTPCGPVTQSYVYSGARDVRGSLAKIKAEEKGFHAGSAPVSLPDWQPFVEGAVLLLHVDRRGVPSSEVALGAQPLRIGEGVSLRPGSQPRPELVGEVYEVLAPSCAEGKQVKVGGAVVGEIGVENGYLHAVIDAQGGHCYEAVESAYSRAPTPAVPWLKPKRQRLSGGRLYPVPGGPPRDETDRLFAGCPSLLAGKVSCTEVSPVDCDAPVP